MKDCCQSVQKPREGKNIYLGSSWKNEPFTSASNEKKVIGMRSVYEIIERTIDRHPGP